MDGRSIEVHGHTVEVLAVVSGVMGREGRHGLRQWKSNKLYKTTESTRIMIDSMSQWKRKKKLLQVLKYSS